jgi:hypothetical protein
VRKSGVLKVSGFSTLVKELLPTCKDAPVIFPVVVMSPVVVSFPAMFTVVPSSVIIEFAITLFAVN